MTMIPFNSPPKTGTEYEYFEQVYASEKWSGDGLFTRKCEQWLQSRSSNIKRALLTPSCTAALELAALIINIQPGDEVIMPSYTFVSTANAFVLRGAKIIFIDVEAGTMNLDARLIEAAITPKTKAIVPVHYAGVACDMDAIMAIAHRYQLWVIEDAAQGVHARHNTTPLGAVGHLGCYSFHETKNYTAAGEGGALLINDTSLIERAEILREKGTNRSQFLMGQVDKYSWQDMGSSYLPGEFQAAFLWAQLEQADAINSKRLQLWNRYYENLQPFEKQGQVELAKIPAYAQHNAHLFFCKLPSVQHRSDFIEQLKAQGVQSHFHYVPLHSSPAGQRFSEFTGKDAVTTKDSERLCRLPLWFNMSEQQSNRVLEACYYALEKQ